MNRTDFNRQLDRLIALYPTGRELSPEAINEYWDEFKSNDIYIFTKTIDAIRGSHKANWFPTIGQINEVYNQVVDQMPKGPSPETGCDRCRGMGLYIDDDDGLAKTCHCPIGQKRCKAWAEHDRKHKYYKAPDRRNWRPEKVEDEGAY